jgi:hypothetical protein
MGDSHAQMCPARIVHRRFRCDISWSLWGGGNVRYRYNPYRLLTDAKGFFASEEAWKHEDPLAVQLSQLPDAGEEPLDGFHHEYIRPSRNEVS